MVLMDDTRNACRILLWKRIRKRSFGRPRRRWEDNIKIDLIKIGCENWKWIRLVQSYLKAGYF
jgi:hypothetical protein